jgi:hypothetical protein
MWSTTSHGRFAGFTTVTTTNARISRLCASGTFDNPMSIRRSKIPEMVRQSEFSGKREIIFEQFRKLHCVVFILEEVREMEKGVIGTGKELEFLEESG